MIYVYSFMWIILLCDYILIKVFEGKGLKVVLRDYTPEATDPSGYSPMDKNIYESPAQSIIVFYDWNSRLELLRRTQGDVDL